MVSGSAVESRDRSESLEDGLVIDGFFRCTAWRSVAENVSQTPKKGMRVFVGGKLVQRTFEVEGQKRYTAEVQVQHIGPDLQFATATIEKAITEQKAS